MALLVFLATITLLALMPAPPRGIDSGWDKLNHVLGFAALAVCASLGQPASRRLRLWLLFGLLVHGASIELLQLFIPSRQAEWGDLLADGLGIVWGAALGEAVLHATAWTQARRAASFTLGAKP